MGKLINKKDLKENDKDDIEKKVISIYFYICCIVTRCMINAEESKNK